MPLTARQAGRYMILFETRYYRRSLRSNLHSNSYALLEFLYLPILSESPYVLVHVKVGGPTGLVGTIMDMSQLLA